MDEFYKAMHLHESSVQSNIVNEVILWIKKESKNFLDCKLTLSFNWIWQGENAIQLGTQMD